MVEGEHFVKEQKAGIRNLEFVGGKRGQALHLPYGIVGEEADRARGERRQIRQDRWIVAAEGSLELREDVALPGSELAVLLQREFGAARRDPAERTDPDKGVAPDLFAAFDRFEEEALVLFSLEAKKCSHRGFKVGIQPQIHRHEGMAAGERNELFAGGLGERRRHRFSSHGNALPKSRPLSPIGRVTEVRSTSA